MAYIDHKRIVRNTAYMLVRSAVMLVVALYTSRLVIQALGLEDYGIINVVAGVIALSAFLNASMSVATQRALGYEMGLGSKGDFNRAFNIAIRIHIALMVVVIIIAETAGLWLINRYLEIPPDRLTACNWVYQLSIISVISGIYQVPYTSAIVANERMKVFAYVGVGEAFAKLVIVFLLFVTPYDRLITYALILTGIQLCIMLTLQVFCHRTFTVCKISHTQYGLKAYRPQISFCGWNLLGSSAWTLKSQGMTILINLFGGLIVNAAYAVATQISNACINLINGFQTAYNPQIVKCYADHDIEGTRRLISTTSRLSYFMMLTVSLPLFIAANDFLDFWLVDIPEWSTTFIRILIIENLITTIGTPLHTAIMASGNIKWYQIISGCIMILCLPISYVLLKLGCSIDIALYVVVIFTFMVYIVRLYMTMNSISLNFTKYATDILFPVMIVTAISYAAVFATSELMQSSLIRLIVCCLASVFAVGLSVLLFGITTDERLKLYTFIRERHAKLVKRHGNKP